MTPKLTLKMQEVKDIKELMIEYLETLPNDNADEDYGTTQRLSGNVLCDFYEWLVKRTQEYKDAEEQHLSYQRCCDETAYEMSEISKWEGDDE